MLIYSEKQHDCLIMLYTFRMTTPKKMNSKNVVCVTEHLNSVAAVVLLLSCRN